MYEHHCRPPSRHVTTALRYPQPQEESEDSNSCSGQFHHGLCDYRCLHQRLALRRRVPHGLRSSESDEAKFEAVTQLYVQADGCIDCGACVPVCTSDAIHPFDDLTDEQKPFAAKNAEFFNS